VPLLPLATLTIMAKSEHEIVCICVVKIIVYYLSAVKPVLWAVRIGALGASVLTPTALTY